MAMVSTTQVMITDDWVKVADGPCEVQSINDRDAFDKIMFDMVISNAVPASNTNAFMRIKLAEHANFHRDAPVWLRLNKVNAGKSVPVAVIKEVAP